MFVSFPIGHAADHLVDSSLVHAADHVDCLPIEDLLTSVAQDHRWWSAALSGEKMNTVIEYALLREKVNRVIEL